MADKPPFRAGDHVHHGPSDETWVVAYADPVTGYLSPCGWPESEALISDCRLVKAAPDEAHVELMRALKRSGGRRASIALRLYGDPDAEPTAARPAADWPFPSENRVFVRVYRLPEKLTNGYCSGPGVPITFTNLDWFEAAADEPRERLAEFIRGKRYYRPDARFLVLGDRPDFVFSIEPKDADHG